MTTTAGGPQTIAWARYPYEGRVVLVTGAGSGIGRSIVRAFLEQGATVCALGRNASSLHETVDGYPADRVAVLVADVVSRTDVEAAVASIVERFSRLDVVVSNAGLSEPSYIENFSDDSWERMRSVNLDAMIHVARATVPALISTRGNFIAMSSVAGLGGDWGQFAYNATKGAVNALIQSLALDLGRHGVRVNAIAPAFTSTRQTQSRLDDPEFLAALLDRVALNAVATPADIARAALFLASPDASYITGVILPVDGGTTASSGTPRPIAV